MEHTKQRGVLAMPTTTTDHTLASKAVSESLKLPTQHLCGTVLSPSDAEVLCILQRIGTKLDRMASPTIETEEARPPESSGRGWSASALRGGRGDV